MKQILFVIAMEKEAINITKKLGLEKIKDGIYRKENISLLITGIGKQQTAIRLTQYLERAKNKPDIIINMGYAGSTNSKIGEWVNVSKSYNYEWNIPGEQQYVIEGFEKNMIKLLSQLDSSIRGETKILHKDNIKELPCYSAESFVTSTNIKDDVLFDMELHSIYLICCIYGIELVALKKVSDNLNLEDYYKNIDMKNVMELTSGINLLL
ncbi:MAG: hypothetical protein ACI4VC_05210, partial [Clostridia bacterium]